jgi:hypothetical protein
MPLKLKPSFTFIRRILDEFILGHIYIVSLKQLHANTRFLTHTFYVNISKELCFVTNSKRRRRLYDFILAFVCIWSSVFCIRVGFRVFGQGSDSGASSSYTMQQKLVDIGWLTLLSCNVIFKFELYRKENEIPLLINTTSFLEKKAIAAGNIHSIHVRHYVVKQTYLILRNPRKAQ